MTRCRSPACSRPRPGATGASPAAGWGSCACASSSARGRRACSSTTPTRRPSPCTGGWASATTPSGARPSTRGRARPPEAAARPHHGPGPLALCCGPQTGTVLPAGGAPARRGTHSTGRLNVKKLLATVALAAALLPAGPARAQVFGQYVPADILPVNSRVFGAYVDFSENVVGALGQLRLSFYPNIDFGFQGGLARLDTGPSTKTTVRLGGDLRFGAGTVAQGMPVDLAVGAALGVQTGDDYTILSLGPEAVASRTFGFTPNASVVPYAGAMLMFSSVDIATV